MCADVGAGVVERWSGDVAMGGCDNMEVWVTKGNFTRKSHKHNSGGQRKIAIVHFFVQLYKLFCSCAMYFAGITQLKRLRWPQHILATKELVQIRWMHQYSDNILVLQRIPGTQWGLPKISAKILMSEKANRRYNATITVRTVHEHTVLLRGNAPKTWMTPNWNWIQIDDN
jgi:hypothetical protein